MGFYPDGRESWGGDDSLIGMDYWLGDGPAT